MEVLLSARGLVDAPGTAARRVNLGKCLKDAFIFIEPGRLCHDNIVEICLQSLDKIKIL